MTKEEFAAGIKILNSAFNYKMTSEDCSIWYEFLQEYNFITFKAALKEIVKTSKFMPKIAEIIEKCEESKKHQTIDLISFMEHQGYFKSPSEKDKAIMFINRNIIPEWFKKDIEHYKEQYFNTKRITSGANILIG